jgi:hypothetical protein
MLIMRQLTFYEAIVFVSKELNAKISALKYKGKK